MSEPTGPGPAARPTTANTLEAIALGLEKDADLDFDKLSNKLRTVIDGQQSRYFNWYEKHRKTNARWANSVPRWLTVLTALAFVMTALAAVIRFNPDGLLSSWDGSDKVLLALVLIINAVIGGLSYIERGTDRIAAYFRHLGVIHAIRDLWTKFQFDLLKETVAFQIAGDEKAKAEARGRLCEMAQACSAELNKLTSAEFGEWKTDVIASLKEMEEAAIKGREEVSKHFEEAMEAALKQAERGYVNVTLQGAFDGEAVARVAGVEKARTRRPNLVLERLVPGPNTIAVDAKRGDTELRAIRSVDVKPGVQDITLELEEPLS